MAELAICAVVITFNPDLDFPHRIAGISRQVDSILIIDNASGPQGQALLAELQSAKRLEIILNPENVGVATAFNIGMERARKLGYKWALALDQDSDAAPNMVTIMSNVVKTRALEEKAAIVAPQTIDSISRKPSVFLVPRFGLFFKRRACGNDAMEVTTAISSGSLINLQIHEQLGCFREDYFIDYVDTEYCLRAKERGFNTIIACQAHLYYRLGERKLMKLGPLRFFPTFHSASRWYTISRNRIQTWRQYSLRFPHWFGYELVASVYISMRMMLTEYDRRKKLVAIARGTWDGLRGRMGPPPIIASDQS